MKRSLFLAVVVALTATVSAKADGPRMSHVDSVNANATDVYRVTLVGGEESRITVVGDGSTDLDLYLYDQNGNLMKSDETPSGNARVFHTPYWTGPFVIKIVNRGPVSNTYLVVVD